MVSTPQIILIDGPAGAGKTTLAAKLSLEFNCEVIHLDDIYGGWADALGPSLTSRLLDLVKAFSTGRAYQLPIYDWALGKFNSVHEVSPAATLIIEGVGAGQSAIRPYASTLYWLDIDPPTGLARVLARDGEAIKAQMIRWQSSEAKHFKAERTRDFADFIISST